jgi:hypothetical protein
MREITVDLPNGETISGILIENSDGEPLLRAIREYCLLRIRVDQITEVLEDIPKRIRSAYTVINEFETKTGG